MAPEGTLGERVRALRKIRGLTQEQLGAAASMPRTDINKIERGTLPLGTQRLERLADALDVSVLELQPEAEADPLGLTLLGRLEAAEAELARQKKRFDRFVRAASKRLAELEAAQQPQARRSGRRPSG